MVILGDMRRLGPILSYLILLWSQIKADHEQCESISPTVSKPQLHMHVFYPGVNAMLSAQNVRMAATLASNDINNASDILDDYELVLNFSDTQCSPSEATWRLVQATGNSSTQWTMFIGGACSLATEPITAVSGDLYGLTQISYGATSPVLRETETFDHFFATIPSEAQSNALRFAMMRKYNWMRVAVIYEAETIFVKTNEDFRENCNCKESLVTRSFVDDPTIALTQLRYDSANENSTQDIRIIFGWFYGANAAKVICEAKRNGIIDAQHVWILPGWLNDGWWESVGDTRCTEEELIGVLKFIFTVDAYPGNDSSVVPSETGKTPKNFTETYNNCIEGTNDEGNRLKYYTYDAILAGALALDSVEKDLQSNASNLTSSFSYNSSVTAMIRSATSKLSFMGLSGWIDFRDNRTRSGLNALYQYRFIDGNWTQYLIAVYDNTTFQDLMYLPEKSPMWYTKDGSPPRDRSNEKRVHLSDFQPAVIVFTILTVVVIVMVVAFFVFTVVTWRNRPMSEAAPYMVTVILIGCFLLLVGSFLLGYVGKVGDEVMSGQPGYDEYCQRKKSATAICNIRLWFFTIGFTLSFGALFSKIWQAYRVYTNSDLKDKELSPVSFFLVIGVFLAFDVLFLLLWTILGVAKCNPSVTNPNAQCEFLLQYEEIRQYPSNIAEDDTIEIYEVCNFATLPYWAGVLLVYKVLVIVFGFFLAYESRNVRYRYLSDSIIASYAMFATAAILLLFGITSLPLVILNLILPGYIFLMCTILAPITIALLMLFIPRFYCLYKKYDTMLSLTKDKQSDLPEVDTIVMGRHNSTVDSMSTGKVTLTGFSTTHSNSPGATRNLIPEGDDDKHSTSTDSGTATADNESDRRPSLQSGGVPSNQEDSKNPPSANEELIDELV